jgi:hypothetical protein
MPSLVDGENIAVLANTHAFLLVGPTSMFGLFPGLASIAD